MFIQKTWFKWNPNKFKCVLIHGNIICPQGLCIKIIGALKLGWEWFRKDSFFPSRFQGILDMVFERGSNIIFRKYFWRSSSFLLIYKLKEQFLFNNYKQLMKLIFLVFRKCLKKFFCSYYFKTWELSFWVLVLLWNVWFCWWIPTE